PLGGGDRLYRSGEEGLLLGVPLQTAVLIPGGDQYVRIHSTTTADSCGIRASGTAYAGDRCRGQVRLSLAGFVRQSFPSDARNYAYGSEKQRAIAEGLPANDLPTHN